MAYKWNEQLMGMEGNWAHGMLLAYSIIASILNFGAIILIFYLYSSCGFGMTMGIALVIVQIFLYVSAVMGVCNEKLMIWRDNWGLFTCSTTATYITYLTWTMLASV